MQITLTLDPKEPFSIPLSYHYQVQSAIYHLLSVDAAYAHFLHDMGYGKTSTRFRLFTFGGLYGNCRIIGKQMQIQGRITLEIRSISEIFCTILKRALLELGEFRLFDQSLSVRMIEVGEKRITAERLTIITRSPIVVKRSDEAEYAACYGTEPEGTFSCFRRTSPARSSHAAKASG